MGRKVLSFPLVVAFVALSAGIAMASPGLIYGATDDLGYSAVENPVDVHDLHATMLRLLGIEHTRLTYRFQGRDYRLTDVAGEVIKPILT